MARSAEQSLAQPLVSIITPSFNQAPYIEETLRSVAEQSYSNIEHIVLDGGSTDGSVDLIRSWAQEHPLYWRSGPDGGQADAIQQGVRLARGDVVAWLNSDDVYLDSQVISDVMKVFETGASAVTGAGWHLSEGGEPLSHIPVRPNLIDHRTLRHVDWILQPATFIRRDVLDRFPIDSSLRYAFDWDLFIRLAKEIAFTPIGRDIAGYRLHPSGKTVSGAGHRKRELLRVMRRYNSRFSPRYALLSALVAVNQLAERLPYRLYEPIRRSLSGVALLSHRVTGGRGIQY